MRIIDFADGVISSVTPSETTLPAANVAVTPTGNLSSTNAQAALQELQTDVDAINSSKAQANGIATLDAQGKVPLTQIPATAITNVFVVADIAARDLLTVEEGDVCKVLDDGNGNIATYIYAGSNWETLQSDAGLALHESATSTHGVSGSIVGTSDQQTLTNKDIDGGTASNTSRLTVPKNTKTNLDALTRKEATLVYGTDTKKAYVDDGANLIPVGSGDSAGGIQYIQNPSASINASNWNTYADAAQAEPVDGTGGSPNVTFTRNTSSPLAGEADFILSKPASNCLGEGISTDFKIDRAYQGSVLSLNYLYSITGTYSTGDLTVWIYDKTNKKMIQPSAFQVVNTGIAGPAQPLVFQTSSNSVDYRLIFHVSTTSASAYTLAFTNISVGPQVVPVGAAVTDWVSFTPLWQSNGTAPALGNGSLTGRWRQVGGAADIEIKLSLGSTSTTGTGVSFITWPSFLALQPLNISFSEGTCFMYTNTTATSRSGTPQFYGIERRFGVYLNESGQWSGEATDWGGAGDTMTISVRGVPVVGWSSNTVVSDSADTRVMSTKMYRSASLTNVGPNNTSVKINLDAADYDTGGMSNTASNRIDVKVPGVYDITAQLNVSNTNIITGGLYVARIYKNGSPIASGNSVYAPAGAAVFPTVSTTDKAVAGDYYELYLFGSGNNSSSQLTIASGSAVNSYCSVSLRQGPSQIAASEVIAVSCVGLSGSVGVENTVVFPIKVFDTHNAYNTSTGVFTAPAPGIYEFKCYGLTNSMTQSTSGALQLYTQVNGGSRTSCAWALGNGANINQSVFGTALISLQAGQTVEFRQTSTTSGTWVSGRYSVIRLGGVM